LKVLEDQASRPAIEELRRLYEARVRISERKLKRQPHPHDGVDLNALHARLIAAQREALLDLRARWIIGDDAFHATEEEIDLIELAGDERIRPED
jgi:monovalent cation/hydrogen antiporter